MRETEDSIRRSMDKLKTTRPFVWEALELRKKLAQWQAQTAGLNIVQLVRAARQGLSLRSPSENFHSLLRMLTPSFSLPRSKCDGLRTLPQLVSVFQLCNIWRNLARVALPCRRGGGQAGGGGEGTGGWGRGDAEYLESTGCLCETLGGTHLAISSTDRRSSRLRRGGGGG